MPSLVDMHIDVFLTNFSVAFTNDQYIADRVFPVVPVDKRSDKYVVYKQETFLSSTALDANGRPSSMRKARGRSQEITWDFSSQSYLCEEYSLRGVIPVEWDQQADAPLAPSMDATIQVKERHFLDNEMAVAAKALKEGNYSAANKSLLTTGGAGSSWATGSYGSAASVPLQAIEAGRLQVKKSCQRPANTILFSPPTAVALANHPNYTDQIKYTSRDILTRSGLIPVIKGLDVIEADTQKNTATQGFTQGWVWQTDSGKDAALIYFNNPNTQLRSAAFGKTFEAPDAATGVRAWATRRWFDMDQKAEVIEVSMTRDWQFICLDGSSNAGAGYLIYGTTL